MSNLGSKDISTFKQLESIFQVILSLTAIIYTLGFIIVNSYYISFGVIDYQLIQTRYIAAGLSYLIIHFGIASMITTIYIIIGIQRKEFWFLVFLALWGLFGYSIYFFSENIVNAIIIGTNAGVATMIGYQMWGNWTDSTGKWFDLIQNRSRLLFIGTVVTIIIYLSALCWGQSYWPAMSSTVGGGRPNEAVFILENKSIPDKGLPLIPMQNEIATEQLPILFDSSDEFVILVDTQINDQVAVRIPKSIILSVIYAPPGTLGKKQNLPNLTSTTEVP